MRSGFWSLRTLVVSGSDFGGPVSASKDLVPAVYLEPYARAITE